MKWNKKKKGILSTRSNGDQNRSLPHPSFILHVCLPTWPLGFEISTCSLMLFNVGTLSFRTVWIGCIRRKVANSSGILACSSPLRLSLHIIQSKIRKHLLIFFFFKKKGTGIISFWISEILSLQISEINYPNHYNIHTYIDTYILPSAAV